MEPFQQGVTGLKYNRGPGRNLDWLIGPGISCLPSGPALDREDAEIPQFDSTVLNDTIGDKIQRSLDHLIGQRLTDIHFPRQPPNNLLLGQRIGLQRMSTSR
jgi:hypothetical protein